MRWLAALAALALLPATAHAQATPEDDGTPIVGGGSFNTAPLLKAGRYADTVAAGETVYWKVAMQKGQILKARATVDVSEIETDYSAPDYQAGLAQLDYRMDVYSPIREQMSDSTDYGAATTALEGADGTGAKAGEVEGPRVLGFEQILASDFNIDKFPAPGEWYLSISVADSENEPAEVPAELPLDLEIIVEGQPQPSSADFASSLATPTPAPTQEPVQVRTLGTETATDAGDPTLTIALVGVLALLGGLGLGALAARVLPR
jgi:Ca-activated chloride channel homolog